jgi:hypothetical protein
MVDSYKPFYWAPLRRPWCFHGTARFELPVQRGVRIRGGNGFRGVLEGLVVAVQWRELVGEVCVYRGVGDELWVSNRGVRLTMLEAQGHFPGIRRWLDRGDLTLVEE